jgi:RNA polymerase sigma-70 factor (ECF subfamily)
MTAEEVVQDAFVKAFQSLQRVDVTRPLGPWLATIAANLVIDVYRRERTFPTPEPFPRTVEGDATADPVLAAEGVRLLRRALRELPTRQRRIFVASVFEDVSAADVARMENISEASVMSVVYRARQSMRRNLRRLATVIVATRIELRHRSRRAASSLDRFTSIADWRVAAGCWCLAVVMAIFPPTNVLSPRESVAFAADTGKTTPSFASNRAIMHPDTSRGDATSRRNTDGPPSPPVDVQATTKTGPTNDGNLAPSSGYVRVDIVGPAGIHQHPEVWYQCTNNGADAIPENPEIYAIC